MLITKILLIFLLTLSTTFARTKTRRPIIEPFIGIDVLGTWDTSRTSRTMDLSMKGTSWGYTYGSKIWWSFSKMTFGGFQYTQSELFWNYDRIDDQTIDDSWYDKMVVTRKLLYGFLGLRWARPGFGFWFWPRAFDQLKFRKNIATDALPQRYRAYAKTLIFGVRQRITKKWVFLNFEAMTTTYDKLKMDTQSVDLPKEINSVTYGDKNYRSFILSLSIPL